MIHTEPPPPTTDTQNTTFEEPPAPTIDVTTSHVTTPNTSELYDVEGERFVSSCSYAMCSVCVFIQTSRGYTYTATAMYHGFDWYGRLLEVGASSTIRAQGLIRSFQDRFSGLWSRIIVEGAGSEVVFVVVDFRVMVSEVVFEEVSGDSQV